MPARALTPTPKTYAQLRDAVVAVVVQGRRAIDRAWLETYHETGRLINEHILQFRDRADYGGQVYSKLAADTQISERSLRQCAQFQRFYPIRHARAELSWGHYQLLVQVADGAQRKAIGTEAIRRQWTTRDLETRVREINAAASPAPTADDPTPSPPVELLTPRRGTPGLHPIVDLGDGPEVDLGFKIYRALGPGAKLTTKDIVRLSEEGICKVDHAIKAQLFTYTATVRKVIDGDTLLVALAIAPGFTHRLKLRLRGLDCPEISTPAGRAAKTFVEKFLRPGDEVIIGTTKPDKYDRYLADVFVGGAASSPLNADRLTPAAKGEVFLNNALLAAGHASRYEGGAKEE